MSFFDVKEITTEKPSISNDDLKLSLIKDKELEQILHDKKKVLLVEPSYQRKYPPMGLAKISSYIKHHGGEIVFARSHIKNQGFDCICITTLFTYNADITIKIINDVIKYYKSTPIIIGGVCVSIIPKYILENLCKNDNVKIFKGISKLLDQYPTDYSVDWHIKPPWDDFSMLFTTRGCPNKCKYCVVRKIEPKFYIIDNWRDQIDFSKPYVSILDNNLTIASVEHIESVVEYLKKHGFKAFFEEGFDCKYITEELAEILTRVRTVQQGIRLAFDRIEEDGIFQRAAEMFLKQPNIIREQTMAYVLYNFEDTPKEADYRAREVLRLFNRPYPQRYIPLNATSKYPKYVGPNWTENLATAFRYFWLHAKCYRRENFMDWIKTREARVVHKLTEEDIAKAEK